MHDSTDDLLQACTVHKVCNAIFFPLELKKLINNCIFKPEKHQIIPMNRLVVKLQSNWITNSKDCFSQLSTMLYNDTGQSGHSQLSITVTSPISKAMLTDFAVHIHHAFIHSDTFYISSTNTQATKTHRKSHNQLR